jgi:hypothetical protein
MTTATTNVNPAPSASVSATLPSNRVGTWLRTRLAAYVATNEEAFRVPDRALSLGVTIR